MYKTIYHIVIRNLRSYTMSHTSKYDDLMLPYGHTMSRSATRTKFEIFDLLPLIVL